MSSHYLILDPDAIGDDGSLVIDGQNARHITKVLRLRPGDHVSISDGVSTLYDVELKVVDGKMITGLAVKSKSFRIPEKQLTLFQGLPKGRKMDLIVEKLTELGVARIVPVVMSRSVPDYGEDRKAKQSGRWRTIANEASKQSKRLWLPEVSELVTWEAALKLLDGFDLVLAPYEAERDTRLEAVFDKQAKAAAVFIGPEGGFDESEIGALEAHGAKTFSLGENILRTETAAIVAAALILDRMNS